MYEHEIRSIDEASKGAKSWMAPEFSTGFFMTPYNPNMWKKSETYMPGMPPIPTNGMGQYMIGGQQMLPNKKKQEADQAYMSAMSSVEKEKKNATVNDLVQDAKSNYFDWIILQKNWPY